MSISSPSREVKLEALVASLPRAAWVAAIWWRRYPPTQVNLGNSLTLPLRLKDTISARRRFIFACMAFLLHQLVSQDPDWDTSPWARARCQWACDYFGRKLLTILPQLQYSSAKVRAFRDALARGEESRHDLISSFTDSIWVMNPSLIFQDFASVHDVFTRAFPGGLEDIPMALCRNALLVWLDTGILPNSSQAYQKDLTTPSPVGDNPSYPQNWENILPSRWNSMIRSRFGSSKHYHAALAATGPDEWPLSCMAPCSVLRVLHALVNLVGIVIFAIEDTSRYMDGVEETACLLSRLLLSWEEEHVCRTVFQLIRWPLETIYPHIIDIQLPGKPYHIVERLLLAPAKLVLEAVEDRDAQLLLNILQECLDCGALANQPSLIHSAHSLLFKISQTSGAVPESFYISDIHVDGDKRDGISGGGIRGYIPRD
ncbi:hypothetical protein JAAARDRAFT_499405 [Jaapia argillacea MUCL 33604]|uniref:Uncharacterized protein n=1 Tax=Jaapia argillacea MUCL 33604 TaxID=933084 RepID=A0A067PAH5_9AGAM|nr:hypothetical protein JAAARDRAFT_499405 [Jaapia argillacea MUCL 33604]